MYLYCYLINIFVFFLFVSQETFAASDLDTLIQTAYKNNPGISTLRQLFQAEKSLVLSKAAPEDPLIGVSILRRNTQTHYGTITQKVRFPVKYYFEVQAQNRKADSKKALWGQKKLKVREEVISLYYSIYSLQKIVQLTQANMRTVKEYARVAEKKYSAGQTPQSDSMKAHFEMTQLEMDLIRFQQEESALQEKLSALLNGKNFFQLKLSTKTLEIPDFKSGLISDSISTLVSQLKTNSPQLEEKIHLLKEAETKLSLTKWEFFPDFQFQYQRRIDGIPIDSHSYFIGLTVPLWFWRKNSQTSSAEAYKMMKEYQVTGTTLNLVAKIKELKSRAETLNKTLKIYKTSLIPQAQGAYHSTRGSYRANKTSFLDLLDSERSLYRVQAGFYQSLRLYVESLCQLETNLGYSVSNLTTKEGKLL